MSKAPKKPKEEHTSIKPTANHVACWDSHGDTRIATERLKQMFVEMGQKTRIERGQKPAERAVFRKQHGIAYGRFIIDKDIASQYKLGIFAGDAYDCAVRFSSDTAPTAPDLHSTLGLGLKLFGVQGPKLLGEGDTADFILQNIDRFFARDVQQMCTFTTAGVIDGDYNAYIHKHPELAAILQAMNKPEASCLSAGYWAILPFKLGEENIVKYRLVPVDADQGAPFDNNDYLALDLQQRLRNKDARFRFEIQPRTNPATMPLDDAQVVWSTEESPYLPIAELYFPQQDICAIGQPEFGDSLAFNIWRTLAVHEPLGSIAQARKVVYAAGAHTRHQANGLTDEEPLQIDPHFVPHTGEDSDCIVTAGIYPPIGVMRVGNSENEYFIGPLVSDPEPRTYESAYRDQTGALKRQAAQFRIYGFNAAGKAVKELTTENAHIIWHAHLANQKASWYQFQMALDIPDAVTAPPSFLRNINVADRNSLIIDGGGQTISGNSISNGPVFQGRFQKRPVYLGEMHTDEKGRLIMLGGRGVSENIHGDIAITFANNEGWYDDISDGPVTAEVEYQGVKLKVDPAWVICAPPDYAPMQKSVRTMWDLMRDVAVTAGMLTRPVRPSFTKDILPIFERQTNLQWVNAGFAGAFGWGGQFDYTTVEWKVKLNDPSPARMEMRRTISNNFRRYNVSGAEAPQLWPWLYGDAVSIPSTGSVRQHSTLSDLQLSFLDQWVKGDFDADYIDRTGCPFVPPPQTIDSLPVAEQPDMLTRAAMEFCLADAFHPGCEMTWPMRTAGMYASAFRLKHAPKLPLVDTSYYGPTMDSSVFTLAKGPLLGGSVPGGITRWMAIPWQTDTASCRDGYTSSYDPYLPTFWPARVPNNILNEERYQEVMDPALSEETRKEAFAYRTLWLDDLPLDGQAPTYTAQINSMVKYFGRLAVVQARQGIPGSKDFPAVMQVGITPVLQQGSALHEALKELKTVLEHKHENDERIHQTIYQHVAALFEGEQPADAKEQLQSWLAHLINQDLQCATVVRKLLQALDAGETTAVKLLTMRPKGYSRVEAGEAEKGNRFHQFTPYMQRR